MDLYKKLRRMHMLLIEDDEWLRDSLRLLFATEGCPIVALETAEEGLAYTANRHVDIIMVDYRLPGMNGLEFIDQLPPHQAGSLKVLITAYGSKEIVSKAKRSGVHAFIAKPFKTETIEHALERMISRQDESDAQGDQSQ